MLGSLSWQAASFEELPQSHVTVGEGWELVEKLAGDSLGLVELAGVNQVDGVVGHVLEALDDGINRRSPTGDGTRDDRRRLVAPLLLPGGGSRRLVSGQAALLVFLATSAGARLVASDLHRGCPMTLNLGLLTDAKFYHVLDRIDADLAEAARHAGCECGGVLHRACYPRKPRGGPANLPVSHERRWSFCCAVDGCRTRATPPSVRFLGRRVYLGAVVMLATAMQHGVSAFRARRLKELLGVDRRTLARWRTWWLEKFVASRFWQSLRGRFMPALDERTLPVAALERLGNTGDAMSSIIALLRLLQPISTTPGLEASAS